MITKAALVGWGIGVTTAVAICVAFDIQEITTGLLLGGLFSLVGYLLGNALSE